MALLSSISTDPLVDQRPPPGAEKRNLLRAALSCFAGDGYAKSSLKVIADEANVTAAMVNYYFGSKEVLYNEVLHMCSEQLEEIVDERTRNSEGIATFLKDFLYAYLEFVQTYPDAAALIIKPPYTEWRYTVQTNSKGFDFITHLITTKFETSINKGELKSDKEFPAKDLAEYFIGHAEVILMRHVQKICFAAAKNRPLPKIEKILQIFFRGTGNSELQLQST